MACAMSDFEKDLLKILLDKGLLGLIAIAFGFYLGGSSENGQNRTLSHQQRSVSDLNRRACRVSAPTLTTPFSVRVFPVSPG